MRIAEANARLIAAAPDLLAAAEALLAGKCPHCRYPLSEDDPIYTPLSATLQHNPTGCRTDALRAAIAKAEGNHQ